MSRTRDSRKHTPPGPDARATGLSADDAARQAAGRRALAAVVPDWPAPPGVSGFVTGRAGGVSRGAWGLDGDRPGGFNLGARCGDDPEAVRENRSRLAAALPAEPVWLRQVHGVAVHVACGPAEDEPVADAAVTDRRGLVLSVLTADCLAVMFTDDRGRAVGVAHAGWRGLSAGVLERTAQAMRALLPPDAKLQAWMGPAIGQDAFEVGDEVREAFCAQDPQAAVAFAPGARPGKWQADLYILARRRLSAAGVARVDGGGFCTFADSGRFWSYRRRADSGRMASLVWIER